MRRVTQVLSVIALLGTVLPPCLLFAGRMPLAVMQCWMLGAALLWLAATPFWMNRDRP